MSLKAKIRNLSKEKDMSAQVILQNYTICLKDFLKDCPNLIIKTTSY